MRQIAYEGKLWSTALRNREPAGIPAGYRQMARRVEREGAVNDETGRDVAQLTRVRFGIGARMDREHDRVPTERRQVLRELERALHAARPLHRWEVKRDHEHASRHGQKAHP